MPHRPSSSAASSRWKLRQGSDPFAKSARVKGLKSRAAFKLLELDTKYHLFRHGKGQVVVDLGYAPGSWSQVAADRTAPNGVVVGIDIIPAQPPKGVSTIQGNFLDPGVQGMVKQFLVESDRRRQAERAERRARRREEAEEAGEEGEGDGEVVADRPSYIDMERMAAAHETEVEVGAGSAASSTGTTPEPTPSNNDSHPTPEATKPNLRLVDVRPSFPTTPPSYRAQLTPGRQPPAGPPSPQIVLSDMSAPWPQTYGFSVNSVSNPYSRMMNTSGIAFKDHAGSMVCTSISLTSPSPSPTLDT